MLRVVVKAPAKLNLALAVCGLLENGYHTVDMIMQAVDIYDTVEISKSMGYSLRIPKSPIPANDKNTATKAAAAFFYETGLLAGADIVIHKRIPSRAGMAGGSADAAAVLVGLNELYGAGLSVRQLQRIGASIGADVPFCVSGGTARAQGIGDELSVLPALSDGWFCVVMPHGGGVSTPLAYKRFDELGSPLWPNVDAAVKAIESGSLDALSPHVQNMLEHANGGESTAEIRAIMQRHGAIADAMTGSGAAVFGLFNQKEKAESAASEAQGMAAAVFVAQPVAHGAFVVNS